jgi:predicted nucleotidyltransferase
MDADKIDHKNGNGTTERARQDVGVPIERLAENPNGEAILGADHDSFQAVLREAVGSLVAAHVPFTLIGGLAVSSFGRPRWTHDIDVFIKPQDADPALRVLAAHGFRTERTDPKWLFKAFKDDVMVDLIFFCTGGFYLEDEMLQRAVWRDLFGVRMPLLPPEDLLLLKAAVHDENGPRHWHDALGILARTRLDWEYLLRRAHRAPRRLLSLLVYAHSSDLAVPNQVVEELFHRIYGR